MEDDGISITTNLVTSNPFRPRPKVVPKEKSDNDEKQQTNFTTFKRDTKYQGRGGRAPKRPWTDRGSDSTTPGEEEGVAPDAEFALPPPSKAAKREQWQRLSGVTPNRRPQKAEHDYVPGRPSKNYVSSLFHNNPDVPEIKQKDFDQIKETVFATQKFDELGIHPYMVANLRDLLKIELATVVQEKVMPLIFEGKDLLVKSQTGSGKTLAYAVPIIQNLQARRPKLHRLSGISALVILPTRELAIQTYELFRNLCRSFQWLVPNCFMGGQKVKSEKAVIRRGINILISTPQRLLEHIKNSSKLVLTNVEWLVLDEADRLMDLGYEKDITTIVETVRNNSQTKIQTILLSATLNDGVHKLAGLSLQNPTNVDVSGDITGTTDFHQLVCPSELVQHFLVVPAKLRLVTLAAFVFWKCAGDHHKIIIFMATQDMVEFHTALLSHIAESEVPNTSEKSAKVTNDGKESAVGSNICINQLHGNMEQQDRMGVFNKFRQCKTGILLCTDVGARGLDLPRVDWIVQYTTPNSAAEYVHRVGRTARIGGAGNALLFLLPSERDFVLHMEEHNIRLEAMLVEDVLDALPRMPSRLSSTKNKQGVTLSVEVAATRLQGRCEAAVLKDAALHRRAVQSFASYVRAYASYSVQLRKVCPYRELHLGHLAKSMALQDTPAKLGRAGSRAAAAGGNDGGGSSFSGGRGGSRGGFFRPHQQSGDRFSQQRPTFGSRRNTGNDVLSEFSSGM